jgi:hypothetical protein
MTSTEDVDRSRITIRMNAGSLNSVARSNQAVMEIGTMRRKPSRWTYSALLLLIAPPAVAGAAEPGDAARICRGGDAGGYAAFPDLCRLKDGGLICAFYSGSGHVTAPSEQWPKCGRISAIRSDDDGKTWSKPEILMDTPDDDRDPSLVCLKDGTLLMNWFTRVPAVKPSGEVSWPTLRLLLSRSTDSGRTWSRPENVAIGSKYSFACSSPIRQLPDDSLLMGLYCIADGEALGATMKSYDGGKTWNDLALIGEKAGIHLDAETDVVALEDGRLLAALRSTKDMYSSLSNDHGKTWGPVASLGFEAHCPYFLRHRSGAILLGTRLLSPKDGTYTALHWSPDEGKTWNGPVKIDDVRGAYPSMVELPDGDVYCVYYEEGPGSSIRARRLRVTAQGVEVLPAPDR